MQLQEAPTTLSLFQELMQNNEQLQLVVYTTNWSGTGYLMTSMVTSLEPEVLQGINAYKLDATQSAAIKEEYSFCRVPSILFFYRGKLLSCLEGIQTKELLLAQIDQLNQKFLYQN
ncbi:MAG: thioredoxin domain-containing protein [Bacteroidota bacterium]